MVYRAPRASRVFLCAYTFAASYFLMLMAGFMLHRACSIDSFFQVFAELIPDALESLSASATGHIVTISVATMVGLQLILENAVH